MNPSQSARASASVVELRSRLHGVNSILQSLASAGGVEDSARNSLECAIQSIEAVADELAAVCDDSRDNAAEHSFTQALVSEAKSEVDSGEFDVHG